MTSLPLVSDVHREQLLPIRAVLTDIDDTLTTHGVLPAVAYDALERLHEAGFLVIPVTGRPAGWCDHIARMWPVDGVVGENGAFYFRYDRNARKMHKVYTQGDSERKATKEKLWSIASHALETFPGTAIAGDQAYREVDVAIDFCEDVAPLPDSVAQDIAAMFHAEKAHAKVSSIHVNAWFGDHDKLTTSLRFLSEVYDMTAEMARNSVAYCGDSPNDAPMFGYFPMAIGVANIQRYLTVIESPPRFLTRSDGGHGFAEFADVLIASRKALI
jgi:HAD superfamily hydrolase (TIGR01484 family)